MPGPILNPIAKDSFGSLSLALLLVVAAALSVVVVGVPGTLLMAGVWLIAFVTNRWSSSLSGPVSWAVGMLLEIAVLTAESALLAFVDPHPHQQLTYVVILLLPIGGAVGLHALLRRRERRSQTLRVPVRAEALMAVAIIIAVELVFEIVKRRGHDYGLAMTGATGDASRQVTVMRTVLSYGGVTIDILKAYPGLIAVMGAILSGAGGRSHLGAGTLLVRDLQAFSATVVLSSVAVSALFVAALNETLPRLTRGVRRISSAYVIPMFVCSSLGVGAYVLDPVMINGWVTSMGSLALSLVALVLALRFASARDPLIITLLCILMFLLAVSWTPLAMVPASTVLVGSGLVAVNMIRPSGLQRAAREIWIARSSLAVAAVSMVVLADELYRNRIQLLKQFRLTGFIFPAHPIALVWIAVAALVMFALAPNRQQRLVRGMALVIMVAIVATSLWLRQVSGQTGTWSYYSTKMLWLGTATVLWIPFVVVTDVIGWWATKQSSIGSDTRRLSASLLIGALIVAGSGGVWVFARDMGWSSTFAWTSSSVLLEPSAEFSLVTKEANLGGPFVIWDYESYDDQIGNFWSGVTWDLPQGGVTVNWGLASPHSFVNWTNTEGQSIDTLCTLIENIQIRVVTADRTLESRLRHACPASTLKALHKTIDVQVVAPPPDFPFTFY